MFDFAKLEQEIQALEVFTKETNFWNNNQKAQQTLQSITAKQKKIELWKNLVKEVQDLIELSEIIEENSNEFAEIENGYHKLAKLYKKAHLELFLNKKYDNSNAIVNITAGTGGTDAQDWAEMLLRMYLRFFEKKGWKNSIIDKQTGQEAGIKSCLLSVKGELVYGYLKAEKGVHRLVRLSPFNAKNLRQTSFALIEIYPEVAKTDEVKIDPKDLKIDTFRASGAGGQHVNTTDSAVRVTHLPTNLVVQCQNERSQAQNREQAIQILQARLLEQKQKEDEAKHAELKGEHQSAAWGNQIRSYVLHPYKMVKDHRTETETSQADKVLDGEIGLFIESWLEKQTIK